MQKWFGGVAIVGALAFAGAVGAIAHAQQPTPAATACPSASPPALGAQATPEPTTCPSISPEPSGTMRPVR
ncbi:MAG: hypothetical protein KGN02_02285 [bacterium]|nr:hypothetical protein [bacterium]